MALTFPQTAFIGKSVRTVQDLMKLYGTLVELDSLWAGAPAYNVAITQEALDTAANAPFAGMTAQNLADAEFALSSIKNTIANAIAALSVLDNMPG